MLISRFMAFSKSKELIFKSSSLSKDVLKRNSKVKIYPSILWMSLIRCILTFPPIAPFIKRWPKNGRLLKRLRLKRLLKFKSSKLKHLISWRPLTSLSDPTLRKKLFLPLSSKPQIHKRLLILITISASL